MVKICYIYKKDRVFSEKRDTEKVMRGEIL